MHEQPATITQDDLAEFIVGYQEAAYSTGVAWDMSDEDGYSDSDTIDSVPGRETVDNLPATVAADIMVAALETFSALARHNNGHTLATYAAKRHQQSVEHGGWELTGHDARLSHDHNGTGLWDRGIEEGDVLHDEISQYAKLLTLDTATDTYYFE